MAVPLTNLTGSPPPPPPPPPPHQKSHFSSLHYGAIAMASIAILLLTYNFIVVRWCWRNHRARRSSDPSHRQMISSSSRMLLPLSKYRKDEADTQASDTECSVCLSVFADGEEVRQLPQCKHSFHADCIDMWLFSHSDCPLCRTKLVVAPRHCRSENSRQRLDSLASF